MFACIACNKGGADSGKGNESPAGCGEFMTELASCYATAGRELSEGGIDPDTWCVAFEEAGGDASVFECYISQIAAGDCSTSTGVAQTSESFQDCEDTD
jgi:hypothetical protein